MNPFTVTYRLKPTPGNMNPENITLTVPKRYINLYGESPLAAKEFASDCFSINAIDYLAITDLFGELEVIKDYEVRL